MGPANSNKQAVMSFIDELKRRNVFRVGIAYVIVAWLLLQVADVVLPTFRAPDWVMQAFTFLVILSFPLALIFAWAFELTPEGIKKEKNVVRSESVTHVTGRKFDFAIIGLLAIAVVFLVVDNYVLSDEPAQPLEKSIAVLPFANRSASEEDIFFIDGLHDDLLTHISKIGSIKTISRTSVMQYRDTNKTIRQIAEELGVATIMEGSVQRAGDTIRINLQLIDAETDEHLWAEVYDRELTAANIFEIQSEIASAIADALRTTLTPAEQTRIDKRGTDSLEAYQLYLKGRSFWNRRTAADLWQAVEYFKAAIEADDEYATAYAGLADTYAHLGLAAYSGAPANEVLPLAKDALLRALELDNEIAEAYAALGFVRTWYDRDWAGAEQAFKRAIELNPNYAPAHQWYSHYLVSQGDYGEAVTQIRKALELDPRSLITHAVASGVLAAAGRADDAIAEVNNALEINPDFWFAHLVLAHRYTSQSMFAEALAAAEKAVSLSDRAVNAVAVQGWVYARSGDSVKATELLHELERRSATEFVSPHNFALLRIGLGQDEQALDDLERAIPQLNLLYLNIGYEYDTLRSNPRFTAIVRQMNLDPESLR